MRERNVRNSVITGKPWIPASSRKNGPRYLGVFLFLAIVCIVSLALYSTTSLDFYVSLLGATGAFYSTGKQSIAGIIFPLNCSFGKETNVCLGDYYPAKFTLNEDPDPPSETCPEYFRWIHEDLWPWRETGITEDMMRRATKTAHFRLVIVNGTAYLEKYRIAFQTRDKFTLYGILQLLRRYPGQIPDLDLIFDCDDIPIVKREAHGGPGAPPPPPLFGYCRDDSTMDIVFPDWTFWGWAETNLKPWEMIAEELKAANEMVEWVDREPYAYWKGNPVVARTREDLLKCNVSQKQDWGARIYIQDWNKEVKQGFHQSKLSKQCTHRYKIFIEGTSWSVSDKYILACDSPVLFVKPQYFDFYTRSLVPLQHYWPIKSDDKCRSIKHAVDWGNNNPDKAQAIGKAGSEFVQENLRMEYVYDYMFHLLSQYAKLLKYKVSVPPKAVELCSESMACPAPELEKELMKDAFIAGPAGEMPCELPPPYDAAALNAVLEEKQNGFKKVDEWERVYWESQTKNH